MKSMKLPRRTALLAATWEDEEQTAAPATGLQYGLIEVFTKGLRAIVDISNDMLEDSAFDMGAEIESEVSEQFAVSEGAAFVNGAGPGQPQGFLQSSDVTNQAIHSGAATSLTADAFISLFHAVKTAYARNGVWAMNRQTVGLARQLKDSVGQYLFMMGLPNGTPNTFLGSPYVEVPDMPAVAAGAYPVAFGDFNRGYSLVDRISMQMLRDPYTHAASNNVRYLFRRRLGGQVTMAEAIFPMLISA
jgi:HK97 family phage major capsid protein